MNTQEYMEKIGVTRTMTVSNLVKKGVISPKKEGRGFVYTQIEVDQYLAYKYGETSNTTKNLNDSTFETETPTQPEDPSLYEPIKGELIEFTHNCWGEPFDNQCNPISPARYSVKTMRMFFKDWACHENDDLFEHLNHFCKRRFNTTISTLKDFFNFSVNNSFAATFDKYFMPAYLNIGGEYAPVHSYDEALARIEELKLARPFRPDWPDVETFTAAFLFYFSMSFNKTVPEFLAAQRSEVPITDIFQYEVFMRYITREADTYPPRWHKTTKVYEGNDIPKALTADGKSRFPDELEDMRYSRKVFKLPVPKLPSITETKEMPGDVYIAAVMKRKEIIEFKKYYGITK